MGQEKIVSQKVNIYSLKSILRTVITQYEEKKKISENAIYQLDIYKEILGLINNVDLNDLISNTLPLGLLLPLIYSNEEAELIGSKISMYAYQLIKLSKNADLEDEYHKTLKKLNDLVNKIIKEYEVLNNKCVTYKQEVDSLKDKAYISRGILYRLNTKMFLNPYQIEEVKKLFVEFEIPEAEQIIILEYINHHNISCKFKNPKLSFTTIKMMEDDFELYDTEELIDKDIKSKLDEWGNSVFNTILTDDEIDLIMFLDEMTSWMSEDMKEYAVKCVLNKFLNALRECKENMMSDNNYDDIEIRKLIIMEYNSYYYKYLRLKRYYDIMTLKEENIDENINDVIEENHLFFAISNDKSYVEKDILDIPKEYYQRVKKLLEGFKYGTLSEHNIENFVSNSKLKGYRKLKEDQIRIVYRPLNSNNYLILGIMLKKSDRANKDYIKIINRDYNYDISDEMSYQERYSESEAVYINLIDYLNEYSRKGNR